MGRLVTMHDHRGGGRREEAGLASELSQVWSGKGSRSPRSKKQQRRETVPNKFPSALYCKGEAVRVIRISWRGARSAEQSNG